MNRLAVDLVSEIGRRISSVTEDTREIMFLFQWLSVALQKGNSVSFLATFANSLQSYTLINNSLQALCWRYTWTTFMVLSSYLEHCESSPTSCDDCRNSAVGRRPLDQPTTSLVKQQHNVSVCVYVL